MALVAVCMAVCAGMAPSRSFAGSFADLDGAAKCEDNSIYKCVGGVWSLSKSCSDEEVCVSLSNTSAVCEVDVREGEMLPEIPTPSPVHPSEKSE